MSKQNMTIPVTPRIMRLMNRLVATEVNLQLRLTLPGEALLKGKLSTVDLLINIGCFVKEKQSFSLKRS
jgi:hypothetical protein